MDWALLVAISRIEGDHGRYGGSALGADDVVSPPIVGIALDGNGVAYIADSDGGAVDGDPSLDRAVGPFQFIPTTWMAYGRDANGDGVADPNSYRDAALAAASYLCAAGGDLRTASGEERAVLAYNNSPVYLADVRALAVRYRALNDSAPGAPFGPLPITQPSTSVSATSASAPSATASTSAPPQASTTARTTTSPGSNTTTTTDR